MLMPLELQLIRARDFIRLSTDGHLDLQTSQLALTSIAHACHKRGISRAMLDLRSVRPGVKPIFTPLDLVALVESFWDAGFAPQQRIAVLYITDPHRRVRLFSFICRLHGWQVRGFGDFEAAMLWLSQDEESPGSDRPKPQLPVRSARPQIKLKL
jgi:hypothetical protein